MSFWSVTGPEPKRNHRWYVTFSGVNLPQLQYALKKVDKPKAKVGEITHKYLNHSFYYPGRLEWESIQMTFASIAQPDATQLINGVLLAAGYGVPKTASGPDQVSTIGKNKFAGAIGRTIDIKQVNADGIVNERWVLNNPFFTNVTFGSLDYANEEIVEIQCTVRYDWAQLADANPLLAVSNEPDDSEVSPNFPTPSP